MNGGRFSSICLLLVVALAGTLAATERVLPGPRKPPKERKHDKTEDLFATHAPVYTFYIDLNAAGMAALEKENKTYTHGTIRVGTNVSQDVAVHLKGNGSFRPLKEKPSFVAKFDYYTTGQRCFGESKIALNNASQDSTYLADFIGNAMFRDAHVPVSRVTHARVILNGRDLGLYVLVEMHNKEFLKRWFRNADGNLYEAYLADVDSQMDQDNGANTSQADRKRLAEIVKIPDAAERWSKLPQVLDVDRYVSHLVCEIFMSHTDGYALNRNNYRIYRHPDTDRFTFIGHGADWAFGGTGVSIQPPQNALVTRAVLSAPEGAKLFKERRLALFTNVLRIGTTTNAACVASWRTRVQLPVGIYFFEGEARGTDIVTKTNAIGSGAGLRLSGGKRENKLDGSVQWTHLSHSLTNTVEDAVELVCELRASKGEVWFDEDTLRLRRQK